MSRVIPKKFGGRPGPHRKSKLPGRLEGLLKSQNLSLRQVEMKAGLEKNILGGLTKAKGGGAIQTWEKLADFFGVSLDYIRGRSPRRRG